MGEFLQVKGYETVSVYRSGAAVKLELNRPDSMNALNSQLRIDLLEAVQAIAADDGVRAVLLTGAGRALSSGADLRESRDRTPEGHPDVYSV
ncbi:MAG TPA: enoyl-CoA hydratase-related protein, partial [Streptosporangiaceae bacterium]